MGPLGGASHVSDAGGLMAVILRLDGELAAPLNIHYNNNYFIIAIIIMYLLLKC